MTAHCESRLRANSQPDRATEQVYNLVRNITSSQTSGKKTKANYKFRGGYQMYKDHKKVMEKYLNNFLL